MTTADEHRTSLLPCPSALGRSSPPLPELHTACLLPALTGTLLDGRIGAGAAGGAATDSSPSASLGSLMDLGASLTPRAGALGDAAAGGEVLPQPVAA